MIETLFASMVSAGALAGLVALIGVLVWGRLRLIAEALQGGEVRRADPAQLLLPLRFAV